MSSTPRRDQQQRLSRRAAPNVNETPSHSGMALDGRAFQTVTAARCRIPSLYRRAFPAGAAITRWMRGDGWSHRRFDWPADGAPRGSILFQGGRGDIIEKYLESFAHWHDAGLVGHGVRLARAGGSGRLQPGSARRPCQRLRRSTSPTVGLFWRQWARDRAGAARSLMGHSMGGHLLLRAMAEGAVTPDAAVLVAPMLGLHAPLGWSWLGERAARLLGGVGNSARAAWRDNEIPRREVDAAGAADPRRRPLRRRIVLETGAPELSLGPPSWAWVIEAFRSTRDAARRSAAADDGGAGARAGRRRGQAGRARSSRWRRSQKLPDARIVRFGPESAHEILREADDGAKPRIGRDRPVPVERGR